MHSRCYSGPIVIAAAMVATTMHEERGGTAEKKILGREGQREGDEDRVRGKRMRARKYRLHMATISVPLGLPVSAVR